MLKQTAMLRGTVDRVRFRGASLEDNPLGDPVERELIVYLPPSYASGTQRYPLVMVLAGFAATHDSLLNFKPWEPNLLERYECLLAAGCGEAILVLPDCFTRLGGSQYLDSPALGRYQGYLADDVLAVVDARYRTLARREARAIVGKSSGGFGALRMGMDRPERFAAIGSHAGDCGFELCIRPRFVEVAPIYERHGGPAAFLSYLKERGGPRSQGEFHALEILALAHAYAPLPEGGGELPIDPRTAMIAPDKWARWLAHDPVVRAEKQPHAPVLRAEKQRSGALPEMRLVFLDAGKSDEYGLQFGARMLAERLLRAGVAVEHEEFEGGHMGTAYRYDVSLPKLITALDHDRSSIGCTGSRAEPTESTPRATSLAPTVDPRGSACEQNVDARGSAREQNVDARGSEREQNNQAAPRPAPSPCRESP